MYFDDKNLPQVEMLSISIRTWNILAQWENVQLPKSHATEQKAHESITYTNSWGLSIFTGNYF